MSRRLIRSVGVSRVKIRRRRRFTGNSVYRAAVGGSMARAIAAGLALAAVGTLLQIFGRALNHSSNVTCPGSTGAAIGLVRNTAPIHKSDDGAIRPSTITIRYCTA